MEPVEKIRESCVDVAQNRQAAVLNSLASKICQIAAVGWRPGGGGEGDEEQVGVGGREGKLRMMGWWMCLVRRIGMMCMVNEMFVDL